MASKVRPGNTVKISITLRDKNGPVKPSDLIDYAVYLYTGKECINLIKVFKKEPAEGEGQINVVDDTLGNVNLIIDPSITKTLSGQQAYIEVVTQADASADYENSKFTDGKTGLFICEFEQSANPSGL